VLKYFELKERLRVKAEHLAGLDPQIFHPLSSAANNPWQQHRQNEDLMEQISKDVQRTFQERKLFRRTETQKALLEILFAWSKENPDVSYKQGMNDLVAIIYLACYRDQYIDPNTALTKSNSRNSSVCKRLCSPEFVEADCFTLFSRLMSLGMKDMFDSTQKPLSNAASPLNSKNPAKHLDANSIVYNPFQQHQMNNHLVSPLLKRCDLLFNKMLKEVDAVLYNHLRKIEIEPQLFLLRWIRLMFSREFHVDNTLQIWDSIFADSYVEITCADNGEPTTSEKLPLMDCLTIAMLQYTRESLLDYGNTECLRRLLKFPPVESPQILIQVALDIRAKLRNSPN